MADDCYLLAGSASNVTLHSRSSCTKRGSLHDKLSPGSSGAGTTVPLSTVLMATPAATVSPSLAGGQSAGVSARNASQGERKAIGLLRAGCNRAIPSGVARSRDHTDVRTAILRSIVARAYSSTVKFSGPKESHRPRRARMVSYCSSLLQTLHCYEDFCTSGTLGEQYVHLLATMGFAE